MPEIGKPRKKERYAWHACWHDDAWRGIELLPPEIVGVYWRIILLMYRRQSALPDNDATMARACFASLKVYRNAKRELLDRQRLKQDEENGLLFCPRAVKQLVHDQRFREAQSTRGKRGGRPRQKPTSTRDGHSKSDVFLVDNSGSTIENKRNDETPEKATHTHIDSSSSDGRRRRALEALRSHRQTAARDEPPQEGLDETERAEPQAPADRTARRRP